MSYRELRNCAEMLRSLGFHRLISVENFRNPNFLLVAEILAWLAKRFDPTSDLPTEVDTEQDRVIFIRSVAQFMASKASVRMNTKRLYQADGFAVQELLRPLSILYGALQLNDAGRMLSEDSGETTLNFDMSNKINDLKHIRSLASEITNRGASLYDLLRREVDLREIRTAVIGRQLELNEVEFGMQAALKAAQEECQRNQLAIENVGSDEANLDAKVEKKKTSLERSEKRLQSLKKVRPAFMEEYEKLEKDLKRNYELFVQRFLCLAFLEQQLDDQDKTQLEKLAAREAATRKLLEKQRAIGFGPTVDDSEDDDIGDDDDDDEDDDDDLLHDSSKVNGKQPGQEKLPNKSARGGGHRVFGNMTGGDLETESLDSDLELHMAHDGGDSDLDGFEHELGPRGNVNPPAGGPPPLVSGSGGHVRRAAAAVPPPPDEEDF